eukprot:CAMPEP_0119040274 /NCGR_PEP_ID=MMETSP1177-20130426/10147_1 /TAXON_ID=2985 /ORGANISM="Ochromonas sp, Strain CCMP1899" /LENGTH=128 /DNA_ID=CAMNT_0007005165 /DNA_START=134 /DNA_END=517 /DNA_ORIENTATION=-
MEVEFDSNKDYYSILGLDQKATIEELRVAHVKLALRYHPDTSQASIEKGLSSSKEDQAQKFRGISEAWSVLSKPDVRNRYDSARTRGGHTKGASTMNNYPGLQSDIPSNFDTQMNNHGAVQRFASSNW